MKLRNKTTGIKGKLTVIDFDIGVDEKEIDLTILLDNGGGEWIDRQFYSLDEFKKFLDEWEEYKSKEPLIKDEEIISLLRPWIKYNGIEKAIILKTADCWFHIKGKDSGDCWWDIEIHASYSESVDKDYHGELVSVEELYGSEE